MHPYLKINLLKICLHHANIIPLIILISLCSKSNTDRKRITYRAFSSVCRQSILWMTSVPFVVCKHQESSRWHCLITVYIIYSFFLKFHKNHSIFHTFWLNTWKIYDVTGQLCTGIMLLKNTECIYEYRSQHVWLVMHHFWQKVILLSSVIKNTIDYTYDKFAVAEEVFKF